MGRWIGLGALVVWGLIIADVLTHPGGTSSASQGVQGIEKPVIGGLLGYPP